MTQKQIEQAKAKEALLEILKPGATVYTILRHVSKSGIQRRIDFYTPVQYPEKVWNKKTEKAELAGKMEPPRLQFLTGYIAGLLGYNRPLRGLDGIKVNGCGMDMGFAVVYELSRELYGAANGGCGGVAALRHEWI